MDNAPTADDLKPADPTTTLTQQLEHQQHVLSQQGADITTLKGVAEAQLQMIGQLQNKLQQLSDDFNAAVATKSDIVARLKVAEDYLIADRLDGKTKEGGQTFDTGLTSRLAEAVRHLADRLDQQMDGHRLHNIAGTVGKILDGTPAGSTDPLLEPVPEPPAP